MIDPWMMRYVYAAILMCVIWAIVNIWVQPSEKVRQTVNVLFGAALVFVAIRLFVWFIGGL
jgi:Na+/phosphate symporter